VSFLDLFPWASVNKVSIFNAFKILLYQHTPEVSDAFWSALTKKMQEQSLVPQGFAGFLGSIFRFAIRTPSIL